MTPGATVLEPNGLRVCPMCGRGFSPRAEVCPDDGAPLGPVDALLGAAISGRYRVEARVGAGGMGAVYRAVQEDLERHVAIKVVSSIALANLDAARRFQREAQIIARLHHPATLKLFDYGRLPDGRPYLVTEFLEGRTLGRLAEDAPLPWPRLLLLLRQVCASLEEAHGQGVIHRDLKPDNIFVVDLHGEEAAKVLDFGIAKLGQSSDTATGLVFGTPAYMSPEQAAGHASSTRSDLYSLGVIAYRCLVGRPPFVSEQPMALLLKHINEAPIPPRRVIPDPSAIPPGVEALILRLLEKDPARRPASAAEVRRTIDGLLGDATAPPAYGDTADGASGPLPRVPRADRAALRFALGLLALILGVGGAIWAAVHEAPVPVVEVISPEPPLPARPPPLEPTAAAPDEPRVEPVTETPAPEPPNRTKRRRPRRRRSTPERPAQEKVEPPPGFLDFELD